MKSALTGITSIEELDLKGKNVFLRLDLNVPMKKGEITDLTRIEAALPTIRYAMEHGAKLVIASHFGRPEKGGDRSEFSLEPVADKLGEILNCEVILIDEPDSEAPQMLLKSLKPNQIIMLENLRFHEDEVKNGENLAKAIALYAQVYVNDAFGACHREHSSIVALPALIKNKGIGFLMKKEIEMLDTVIRTPASPFITILGGSKVSDKVGVIENLIDRVDVFLIGGAMAYTFLSALDVPVGKSRVEKDKLRYVRELMERVKSRNKRILLPVDHRVVPSLESEGAMETTFMNAISENFLGVDIGPRTTQLYKNEMNRAKTIFWNGPMGIFETKAYSQGTFAIAQHIGTLKQATTIVGGGDSAAAMVAAGCADQVTHISTGGGASLEFLQGDKLPGIEALRAPTPKT